MYYRVPEEIIVPPVDDITVCSETGFCMIIQKDAPGRLVQVDIEPISSHPP